MNDKALEIIMMNDPARCGLEADILSVGDSIIEVAGHRAQDQLDFHYYTAVARKVRLSIKKKNGELRKITLDADILHELNLTFSPMNFRRCRCKCKFCFVDQMPHDLRDTLYLKDEDFRLSFLYGNFTTLNDITDAELDRIIEQGISPQYVSVHAVDPAMREWIFGRPMKRNILDILRTLAEGDITVHTQAVLIPGKNDGKYLDSTITALERLHANIESLAVVPVGLTRHREGLPLLRTYRTEEMFAVLDQVAGFQESFVNSPRAGRFVHLSDEWYIETKRDIPDEESYEGFPQLDNGVGMTRNMVAELCEDIAQYGVPDHLDSMLIVTGALGERVFSKYILPLFAANGCSMPAVLKVDNHFFGETVTTSGLLTHVDIVDALQRCDITGKTIYLPPNVLNYEGAFLDGPSLLDFSKRVGRPVVVPQETLLRSMIDTVA
ncbi:MAG: DUF512 domain-containing protein [Candidatus Latescibacterota bacterium]